MASGICDNDEADQAAGGYALVEVWRGVCQVLHSDTRILDIWSSWAQEQCNVYFEVKRLRHPKPVRDPVRSKPVENRLEKIRAEMSVESQKPKTRRLSRRNSSLNRPRRAPDTFHPSLAMREEAVDKIETSVKDLVRRSEQLKLDIGRLERCDKDDKKESHDTSDSGIVTDDSEVTSNRKSYYEEPWKAPRIDDVQQTIKEIEKLKYVNLKLENNEEEILALNFEFAMLEKVPGDARVLDNFFTDVTKLREINGSLLEEITQNRDSIEKVVSDKEKGMKIVQQLEFDLNMIERERMRLETSLNQLQRVELPDLPICDTKVTSDSNIFSPSSCKLPCQVLMSPSTLV